jgi:hypothetical protein
MHAHLPRDGQRRNRRPSAALICERPIEKDRQAHAWLCSTASPCLLGLGPYSPSTSAYRLSAVKKNPPMGGQETAPLTLFSEGKARQDVATDYPGEFRSFSNGRVFSRADTMRNGGKMWTTVWCSHASMATAPAAGRTDCKRLSDAPCDRVSIARDRSYGANNSRATRYAAMGYILKIGGFVVVCEC